MNEFLHILFGIVFGACLTYTIIIDAETHIIKIPLRNGEGKLDGRIVHFNTLPHNYAKLQKPTGTIYELQTHYPNGEYYNSYPYFPSKYESP